MNKQLTDIISEAKTLHACGAIDNVTDWASLCGLFFSPQGREFCALRHFPDMATFAAIKNAVESHGIYVNGGVIVISDNRENVAFVGDTQATVLVNDTDKLHHIIAMHGAHVRVVAEHFAVVSIQKYADAVVEIETPDNTAVIMEE